MSPGELVAVGLVALLVGLFAGYALGLRRAAGLLERQIARGELVRVVIRSAILDDRTCPDCDQLDGIPMIPGWLPDPPPWGCSNIPPDGGEPRCRCVLLPVVDR